MADTEKTAGRYFDLLHRFFDEAWPATLTPTESLVWLAMLRHADNTGEAWPGSKRLGRYLGHKSGVNVRRVRGALERHGLLVAIDNTGRVGPAHYHVCIPGTRVCPKSAHGKSGTRVCLKSAHPCADSGAAPVPESGAQRTKRTPKGTTQGTGEAPPVVSLAALPVGLQASCFEPAWAEWIAHKAEQGDPLSARRVKLQLDELASLTPEQAAKQTREAIAGNFKKIYTDRIKKGRDDRANEFKETVDFAKHITTVRSGGN